MYTPILIRILDDNLRQIDGVRLDRGGYGWLADGSVLSLSRREGGPGVFQFVLAKDSGDSIENEFEARYERGKLIGRGGYSTVYEARDRSGGGKVAVKVVRGDPVSLSATSASTEVDIMEELDHPNIVKLEAVFRDRGDLYIVLELIPEGNLLSIIMARRYLDELYARDVTSQVNNALVYLHSKRIIHRDIKPENILVASVQPVMIKVADFGLAAFAGSGAALQTVCGTYGYMAPEIENPRDDLRDYHENIDSWSLGATVFVMLSGFFPSSGRSTASTEPSTSVSLAAESRDAVSVLTHSTGRAGPVPVLGQSTGPVPVIGQLTGPVPVLGRSTGPIPVLVQSTGPVPVLEQSTGLIPVLEQSAGPLPALGKLTGPISALTHHSNVPATWIPRPDFICWDVLPAGISDAALDFIGRSLQRDPAVRITPRRAQFHPWLVFHDIAVKTPSGDRFPEPPQ
ncbi:Pkinase-domain-containing protein [Artomyces pyxidatus]|uniref:Pkinase-domain-containing protein n=1 Tax=Artomyces pyxidatus TaxID=48021 RepID=A0ACB8SPD4_9AGAM|nr:Pkinase-domain-containing protein [Artomyces pyxidatus]